MNIIITNDDLLPRGGKSEASSVIIPQFPELAAPASDPLDGLLYPAVLFHSQLYALGIAFPCCLAVGEVGMRKILWPRLSSPHSSLPARAVGDQCIALGIAVPIKTKPTSRVLLPLSMMCKQAEPIMFLEISCKSELTGLLFICLCALSLSPCTFTLSLIMDTLRSSGKYRLGCEGNILHLIYTLGQGALRRRYLRNTSQHRQVLQGFFWYLFTLVSAEINLFNPVTIQVHWTLSQLRCLVQNTAVWGSAESCS